jgi:flagellar motor switch protein FliM
VSQRGTAEASRRQRSEARSYDFRRPVRLAREQAHLLRVAMTTFGRQSTTVLTTTLRALSQLTSEQLEELSYDEFIAGLPDGTVCAVLAMEPWQGKALLTLPQAALLRMIDHLLGGVGGTTQPDRPLTDIEQVLIRQLLQRLLRELAYALEPIDRGMHPQLLTLENDPRFVQAAAPTDPVIVARMDLTIAEDVMPMALCIPYPMLAPVFETIANSAELQERQRNRAAAATVTQRRLTDVAVEVAVRFDPIRLPSHRIGRLAVGDVVTLGHRTTVPLSVTSAATVFARAVPGSSGKSLAVLIVPSRSEVTR